MLGQTIDGKYQIVRLLGQGGMGAVYEASHLGTGRRVALKVIIAGALSRDAILRFQREARAAGVIESQHIVQVLDTGIDRELGVPFMVMEYLVGEDLQKLCERLGPLPPELALRIAAQACSGLHKAHEAHVIHRDIKPANLYLARRDDSDVVVRLLDFGIAKVKEDQLTGAPEQALTRTGSMLGSPLYMSPEQAIGSKTINHRTDVWSLGAVLYEVLAGKTPHHGAETLGQLIMAICSAPPAPLAHTAPSVPREVAELVHRALRLDPNERFQSAAEMRDAIRRLLPDGTNLTEAMLVPAPVTLSTSRPELQAAATGGAPARSTAGSFTRSAGKPSGKAPLVAGLVAVLGLGAAGAAAFWFMSSRTDAAASRADASAAVTAPPVAAAAQPAAPLPTTPPTTVTPSASTAASTVAPASSQAPIAKSVGHAPAAVKSTVAAVPAAAAARSPAPGAAPAPAPTPPAPKPTGLTVDRNFE